MLEWLLGFIDRHPGWALLWSMYAFAATMLIAMAFASTARGVADWLWPRLNKDKDNE